MRITKESDYAIRCILSLINSQDKVVNLDEIASTGNLPKSFTSKVLQKLSKAKLIESCRGKSGGYRLALQPEDITVYHIINAIEQGIVISKSDTRIGDVLPIWGEIRQAIENVLKKRKLLEQLQPMQG